MPSTRHTTVLTVGQAGRGALAAERQLVPAVCPRAEGQATALRGVEAGRQRHVHMRQELQRDGSASHALALSCHGTTLVLAGLGLLSPLRQGLGLRGLPGRRGVGCGLTHGGAAPALWDSQRPSVSLEA